MTLKEQTRLQVLNSLMAEHMTLDQAATLMSVSPRHTRRILAAYREEGAAAVAHGHRGRRPPNATLEGVVADMVHLACTRYAGVSRVKHSCRFGVNQFCRFLTTLLGCIGAVAGDVKLEDHGVMHHPVDGCGDGHRVGEDPFRFSEDQVRGYAQRELSLKVLEQGGDYFCVVKDNQPGVRGCESAVRTAALGESFGEVCHEGRRGDRWERRRLWASAALNEYLDWPGWGQAVAWNGPGGTRAGRRWSGPAPSPACRPAAGNLAWPLGN